jgi:hypothetical protein
VMLPPARSCPICEAVMVTLCACDDVPLIEWVFDVPAAISVLRRADASATWPNHVESYGHGRVDGETDAT